MSSDGGLRPLFRQHLRDQAHWQSIEVGLIAAGVPDSNVCLMPGREVWVEMKQTSSWAVGVRTEQIGWHKHRIRMGGRTFVATRRRHDGGPRKGPAVDELWLCSGNYLGMISSGGLQHPDINWSGVWSGGPTQWNWDRVRQILENEPCSV